ncbi:hypothetical protein EQG41_16775 [Billgrantia azerbaijanica]|nr:hypothetical protein EQG41_16775 [Halomonas azerbaijanica]
MTRFHTRFQTRRSTAPERSIAKLRALRWLAVTTAAFVLAGCMAPRPGANLPPYGDSVRHTKAIQTYEPGDEVPPLHGAKAAEAMRTYRIPPTGGGQAPSSSMQ